MLTRTSASLVSVPVRKILSVLTVTLFLLDARLKDSIVISVTRDLKMTAMETALILMNAIRVRLVLIRINVPTLMEATLVNVVPFINPKRAIFSTLEISLIKYAKVKLVCQLTHVTVVSVQLARLVPIFILIFPVVTINQSVNVQ